jgi:hypothetical protein
VYQRSIISNEWNLIRSTDATEEIKIILNYATGMNGWM